MENGVAAAAAAMERALRRLDAAMASRAVAYRALAEQQVQTTQELRQTREALHMARVEADSCRERAALVDALREELAAMQAEAEALQAGELPLAPRPAPIRVPAAPDPAVLSELAFLRQAAEDWQNERAALEQDWQRERAALEQDRQRERDALEQDRQRERAGLVQERDDLSGRLAAALAGQAQLRLAAEQATATAAAAMVSEQQLAAGLRGELAAARSELDAARAAAAPAQAALDAAQAVCEAAQTALEAAQAERDAAQAERDAAQAERDAARAELAAMQGRQAAQQAEAKQFEASMMARLEGTMGRLRRALAEPV